jgi:hypothetical protein
VAPRPQVRDDVSRAVAGMHVEVDNGDAFEFRVACEGVGSPCDFRMSGEEI